MKKSSRQASKSDFEAWFKAQYGSYNQGLHHSAQQAVDRLTVDLQMAHRRLDDQNERAARYSAALQAWQAAKTPTRRLRAALKGAR